MTIGQRIAQKRKEQGLSQETLGESLGVSRQSVYKWESDSALPEIDKLIAMSRIFGVTVGWLLGVEEPPVDEKADEKEEAAPEESGGGELTEAQLKMVEEIVDRYIAARPKPGGRRLWPWVIAAAAVICVFWSLFSRLDTLNNQYVNLQDSVNHVRTDVNNQIYSITNRVEEVLKSQNSLTADYATEIVSADLSANTVTISARATPKTYTEGMTAVFLADTGDGPVEYPGELGPGREFSALLTCELTDSITVSVVFVTGDVRETQILYIYSDLYSGSLPSVHVEDTQLLLWKELSESGKLVWNDEYVWFRDESQAVAINAAIGCAEIREMKVGLFRNRELVTWLESCEWPKDRFQGDWSDCRFYRLSDCIVTPEATDVFCLAAVVTDEYGRELVCMGALYALDKNDELMYADAAWDTGDWYDQSTWRY